MGFYIRKALKVGPLRFNLSKSGIGVSAGVTGLRFGAGPRGNYIHMGREGLYLRRSLPPAGKGQPMPTGKQTPASHNPSVTTGGLQEIDSGSVLQMTDASSAELLQELNDKHKAGKYFQVALILSAVLLLAGFFQGAPWWLMLLLMVGAALVCWVVFTKDQIRKTTVLFYELETDVENAFQKLHDAYDKLKSCSRAWHIEAQGDVKDKKYHGGAGAAVQRSVISLDAGAPPGIKSNLIIPLIPTGIQTLAFMPDRLLVFDRAGIGAVHYKDLELQVEETKFIEQDNVPSDAKVVEKTWRYINKKGGPDMRFKDNPELPICAYEVLRFRSKTGLNEEIYVSRSGVAEDFVGALATMKKLKIS